MDKDELSFTYFPEDYRWSHGMLLPLGGAPWGGGEIGEIHRVGLKALAREFLQAYPTPDALTALTARQWQRWARGRRLSAARIGDLWNVLQQPQLPVPAHVGRAKARLMQSLVEQLTPVVTAVAQYRKVIDDFFARMPAAQWARDPPDR